MAAGTNLINLSAKRLGAEHMKEGDFRHTSRTPAPASTGSDSSSSPTNTCAPVRAPDAGEWKRGERCRTAEERAAKEAYFYARKLTLQRAKRASSPRIDYMPSPEVWRAIQGRRREGRSLSAIVDELVVKGTAPP
jgi:hypothetical protein